MGVKPHHQELDRYDPPHESAARAQQYLLSAWKSSAQALEAIQDLREKRRKELGLQRGGRTSDQDQDLLRAMLVFACAGVDEATKALIEDALPHLADMDGAVQENSTSSLNVSEGGPRAMVRSWFDTLRPTQAAGLDGSGG